MAEKDIERSILDWLNVIDGCFAIKINTIGVFDPTRKVYRKITNKHIHKGTSDILACYRGRFVAIEVKYRYSKPSANQKLFLKRIRENGGVSLWTNSLEDCKVKFRNHFPDHRYSNEPLFDEVY